jgi:hypothetical protein
VCFQKRSLPPYFLGSPEIVCIEKRDIPLRRFLDSSISRYARPLVFLIHVSNPLVLVGPGANHFSGSIGGPIVNDDDFAD